MTSSIDPRRLVQAAHLTSLRAMYPDLDTWRHRSRVLEEPQLGSEMAADTAATHGMGVPFATLARHSLISATQHLNLARTSVESGQVFPIAHPTVLRGALLSASRGVWLLDSPEAQVRQERATRLARTMHQQLLNWVKEPENDLVPATRDEAEREVQDRLGELDDRQMAPAVSETEVIRCAGEIVFSNPHQRGAVVALWRELSGDAHGLLWTTMTRASTARSPLGRDPRYPSSMTQMTAGGDLQELVNAFSAAYRILKVGWSLFDQRCTAP